MIKLHHGDSLDILKTMEDNSIDSICTDPPYGISLMSQKWDYQLPSIEIWKEAVRVLKPGGFMLAFSSSRTYHRMVCSVEDAGFEIRDQLSWIYSQAMPHGLNIGKALSKKHPDIAEKWNGFHSALKPCMEPIVLAMKPYDGTITDNILKYDVGGLNIDDCRIPIDITVDDPRLGGKGSWSTEGMAKNVYGKYSGERSSSSELGRFPGNVIIDDSDDVQEIFDSFGVKSSGVPGKRQKEHHSNSMGKLGILDREHEIGYADKGSASRFFYCAKVSPKERQGSKHPSIKPIKLMEYLTKLITPKGGTVLDPFAGTGTTGEAAANNGFNCILIEREKEYINDCKERLVLWLEE